MNMGIISASRLRGTGIFNNSEAYYKCDGNTSGVLLNSKGSSNGTLSGGITQGVSGKIGLAVESDGTNMSYLRIPRETFNENNFNMSFWMYYSSNFSNCRIITRSRGNGLYVQLNNKILVDYMGVSSVINETSNLILNSWNQIIIQKLGEDISIYVNNILRASTSFRYQESGLTDLFIGVVLNRGGSVRADSSKSFLIDEIDIRKEQYTQQQRDELYNSGNGTTI
jgi:hypothetical protein